MDFSFELGDAEQLLGALRRGAATDLRELAAFLDPGCGTAPPSEPSTTSEPPAGAAAASADASAESQPATHAPHHAPAARARPSVELLSALAPHIAHELVAMEHSRARWAADHSWIALEATLLHTRIVTGFLWSDLPAADAVMVNDYTTANQLPAGPRPEVVARYADAIDRQLSGVTSQRVTGTDAIPVGQLVDAAWAGWRSFLTHVDDERYAGLFRWYLAERADQWQVRLPDGVT